MILQSLVQLYEVLKEQKKKVPEPGWGKAKVSYRIMLDKKGNLRGLVSTSHMEKRGQKDVPVPTDMRVPEQEKRSSGVKANFLCDTSSYVFGIDDKGKPARSKQCFDSEKSLCHQILDACESEEAKAVLAFFDTWDPDAALQVPYISDNLDDIYEASNFIFQVDGRDVLDVPEICSAWETYKAANKTSETMGRCLVTGVDQQPIARLHPNMKGVPGAQSSGAALVSFNAPSFESYGHEDDQGLNAPVSEYAAFAYGTALNALLADKEHAKTMGGTTIVYWSKHAEDDYAKVFGSWMSGTDHGISDAELDKIMSLVSAGIPAELGDIEVNPEEPFYMLGLSPNAARLSVRFFLENDFGHAMKHICDHQKRMRITGPKWKKKNIPIWRILKETVNPHSKDSASSPLLAGALFRAILTGSPYPEALYRNILLRVRAGQDEENGNEKISYEKAACIKAYLLKNHSQRWEGQITMAVNQECNEVSYVLGRLFAVLEDIQKAANPDITTTIKDRYFNAACTTPAVVYPLLLRLSNSHLRKMKGNADKGKYITGYSKKVGKLLEKIQMPGKGTPLPKRLTLEEQGAFILGYYQETQERYTKKSKESVDVKEEK